MLQGFCPVVRRLLIIVFTVYRICSSALFFGAVLFMMSYFIHNACGDSRRFGNLGIQNRKDLENCNTVLVCSIEVSFSFFQKNWKMSFAK